MDKFFCMANRRCVRPSKLGDSLYHGDAQVVCLEVDVGMPHVMLMFKLRLSEGVDSLKTANNLNERFVPDGKQQEKCTYQSKIGYVAMQTFDPVLVHAFETRKIGNGVICTPCSLTSEHSQRLVQRRRQHFPRRRINTRSAHQMIINMKVPQDCTTKATTKCEV